MPVIGRLHDDETDVAVGPRGRGDEVDAQRRLAARLEQEPAPQLVGLRLEVALLLEHRGTRRRKDAPDDHVVVLAADVAADHGDRPFPLHQRMVTSPLQ
jgi:hypothetical protein